MRRIVMLVVVAVAVLGNSHVMVKVPNLLGMEERPARILLAEKGLRADVVRVPNELPAGIVCGQGPGPGVEVMEKYEVRVTVSKGPTAEP
jgi:eukaryotic-like serine/threonine-protein kinase